mmetsp:Transcript_74197/g.174140  ORF Transcript_74197/g.174140 Transcript_74197/m.174140 type:complete len:267 (-) Transcript_74197:240-1040(-)
MRSMRAKTLRSSWLLLASMAASWRVRHRCRYVAALSACEAANRKNLKRAAARGRKQKGNTFCSMSLKRSGQSLCVCSFCVSSGVGSILANSSTMSSESASREKSSVLSASHTSSDDTGSLLKTMAMFCALESSRTFIPSVFLWCKARLFGAVFVLVPLSRDANASISKSLAACASPNTVSCSGCWYWGCTQCILRPNGAAPLALPSTRSLASLPLPSPLDEVFETFPFPLHGGKGGPRPFPLACMGIFSSIFSSGDAGVEGGGATS